MLLLKLKYPQAKLVSGNTEVGIEVKFKKKNYDILIYVGDLKELKGCEFTSELYPFEENFYFGLKKIFFYFDLIDSGLIIGANITLAQFQEILQEAGKRYKVL